MPKREAGALFIPLNLDPNTEEALYRQLYEAIRHAILHGQLAAGTRLPSTRSLAQALGIARTTVVNAFEQLLAEGYVEGQQGSGTYVAAVLPDQTMQPLPRKTQTDKRNQPGIVQPEGSSDANHPPRRISQRGRLPRAQTTGTLTPLVTGSHAFAPGMPDLNQFPVKIWARLSAQRWRNPPRNLLGYNDPAGYSPLRTEIAAYLRAVRAVHCHPEQVMIVSGAQQGITLAAHVLLDPGDKAWIEDPCYSSAHRALLGAGAILEPIPVNHEGLDVATGMKRCPEARLVYVTPSYQYPLGVTMSLARRLLLLQWASRAGAWILEDDYDCEYRYAGRPLSSLQGLDSGKQVIYIGTFSKVLFPGLRLGYLVVPSDLVDAFAAARSSADRHSAMHEQIVLTDFINEGHFTRHIRHMRQLYAERQATLVATVRETLGGLLDAPPADAGMHLIGRLADGIHDFTVFQRAAEQGIIVPPLSQYCLQTPRPNALLLGYTGVTPEEIRTGVEKLAKALQI